MSHVDLDPALLVGVDQETALQIVADVAAGRRVLVKMEEPLRTLTAFEARPHVPANDDSPLVELLPLEIRLLDEHDKPIANARFEVRLPGGDIRRGTLDRDGFVRLEDVPKGACSVTFPELGRTFTQSSAVAIE